MRTLQPHADDVPLSCGGTAAATAAAGHLSHILTVFAGEVLPQMVGEFAAWKHSRWGLKDVGAVSAVRRAEDAEAAKSLGCTIRWLGLPDAIYRGDSYTCEEELFASLGHIERELADHIAEELQGLPEWQRDAIIYVPLGIGSHVDHQILFHTGRRLAQAGYQVLAYEDAPYVIHTPEGRQRRLSEVGGYVGEPILVNITGHLEVKLDAIASYRSQVPVIFRFTKDFREAVTEHALATGAGRPAERFWQVLA